MQGIRFIIQSDRSPEYLDERIENFVSVVKENLESMKETEFEQHKEANISITKNKLYCSEY